MDVARICRESGSGAAIGDVQHAPKAPFELPDGTVVNPEFAVANLLFGKDDDSVQRRQLATEEMQSKLSEILSNIGTGTSVHTAKVGGTKEQNNGPYSASASVGITQRRTQQAVNKKRVFSNPQLQKACQPYLQTMADQITASPISAMVCDSAFACDRDQQAQLLGNVVVAGGGACIGPTDHAFTDKLREDVEAIIHQHTPGWRVKVLSPNLRERSVCSWLGASILASLGTFHDMWISRTEYDEWGPAIVNRKCP
eukprot:CAMPEP_0118720154 /NCGR_PEP_ID=MMETSP0800-20121206/29941_1 /TAXON_ID=210618 ORGANISM="Striatella unipunctata, Strain CCMP2910" /NCGR_SAMPLE_ID=MMETSP0800 /ASSEMBLY_ACC=CAM_ASM_000638 /LENGTH=254 /DNA_ID=CAMNT_0006627739 /DNA_START=23 /DNA_END=788 /DNA_ORIENTATION=+